MTLARAETATGRYAAAEQLGWAFPEPLEDAVVDFLRRLDRETYTQMQSRLVARDIATFVDIDGMRDLLARVA